MHGPINLGIIKEFVIMVQITEIQIQQDKVMMREEREKIKGNHLKQAEVIARIYVLPCLYTHEGDLTKHGKSQDLRTTDI